MSVGENSGETGDKESGEEEEGVTREGGEEVRVDCLSALVPLLSAHPSLHHMAHSGQLIQWLYYGGREVHSHFAFPFSRFAFSVSRLPHFCGVSPFPVFVFRISRFPFRSRIFLVAFAIDRFVFRASRFSFLVSCISFHINFLVLRSVIPVVPPLTRADFTELERRHRQMGGSD